MLPAKEGKELVYQMRQDGIISVKVVPRGTDFGPSRVVFLFFVDLPRVARALLRLAYKVPPLPPPPLLPIPTHQRLSKALANASLRRQDDLSKHRCVRLLLPP